jgi:hydrogenase expression/formation protein HypE
MAIHPTDPRNENHMPDGPILPVGKLPLELLDGLLARAPLNDHRVLLGPGIGLDCAVIDNGPNFLVYKSDPITFATEEIGWYGVQVAANDIATTGAAPLWYLLTLLLPENGTTPTLVDGIINQVYQSCRELAVSVIGGHTEITSDLRRPILVGTMVGEVEKSKLVTPRGAAVGDRILLTKGIPIEATSLAAREFPERLKGKISAEEIREAAAYLYNPGISVVRDARLALSAGKVSAMHDPTEGGLAGALWELAQACQHSLVIDPGLVKIPDLSQRICQTLGLDPLAAIASGALLLTTPPGDASKIVSALENENIPCSEIGHVEDGPAVVWSASEKGRKQLVRPGRDEITKLYEG